MTGTPSRQLDRQAILDLVEGDVDLLVAIIDVFLSQLPQLVENIRISVHVEDPIRLAQAAHALKGSVSNFSQDRVYELSSRLEEMGRSGETEEAEAVFAVLRPEAEALESALRALADEARTGHVLEDA